MCNKLSTGQCHFEGCSPAFLNTGSQLSLDILPHLSQLCLQELLCRNHKQEKKKSEISPLEENFQKEPVGSSQTYSISPHLLLQQTICPQDCLSHELHALLITDTLIMLQALTAKCHPSHTVCPQSFSKPLWK